MNYLKKINREKKFFFSYDYEHKTTNLLPSKHINAKMWNS